MARLAAAADGADRKGPTLGDNWVSACAVHTVGGLRETVWQVGAGHREHKGGDGISI
jgi:hypothetical protein